MSQSLIQTVLINSAKTSNILNVDTSSIIVEPSGTSTSSVSNNNDNWWLPLAIVPPIFFACFIPILIFFCFRSFKKVLLFYFYLYLIMID